MKDLLVLALISLVTVVKGQRQSPSKTRFLSQLTSVRRDYICVGGRLRVKVLKGRSESGGGQELRASLLSLGMLASEMFIYQPKQSTSSCCKLSLIALSLVFSLKIESTFNECLHKQ